MDKRILELTVTSVTELVRIVEAFGETFDLFYRGQSAQYPALTTALERHHKTPEEVERANSFPTMHASDSREWLKQREVANLEIFQSRARHFLDDLPASDNFVEWFALMQHHGAPTRLLDVTKSLFVALYFATEHTNEHDGIVYSFFTPTVLQIDEYGGSCFGGTKIGEIFSEVRLGHSYPVSENTLANRILGMDGKLTQSNHVSSTAKENELALIAYQSARPTKREISQQGCFLMPSTLDFPMERVMRQFYSHLHPHKHEKRQEPLQKPDKIAELSIEHYWSDPVIKLRIPRDKFRDIKLALRHMNITTESLFPDFDGLARSIHSETSWSKEVYG